MKHPDIKLTGNNSVIFVSAIIYLVFVGGVKRNLSHLLVLLPHYLD